MERLNDNEVKEVAEMQRKIDDYEYFIRACFIMAKSGKRINYPVFKNTDFFDEMNEIWQTVRDAKCKD